MKKHLKWIVPVTITVVIITVISILIYVHNEREEYYRNRHYKHSGDITASLPYEYDEVENEYGLKNPRQSGGDAVWDTIYFGNYYQSNENTKEPIQWRVLSVEGSDAFLLSEKGLDCQKYNNKLEDVTWENCSLRKWLNNDFLNEAFNEAEKNAIPTSKVKNRYYYQRSDAGNDTKD